jgi:formate hydrogenlyase subunit 4
MARTTIRGAHGQEVQVQSRAEVIADRLIRWLGCSVLIALVPIGFAYKVANEKVLDFLGRGDLFILALALAAAAIGELLGPQHPRPWIRNSLLILCTFILLIAFACYAAIAGHIDLHASSKELSDFSWKWFLLTLFVGSITMMSTAEKAAAKKAAEDISEAAEDIAEGV